MKHAFLIMAHNGLEQLELLMRAIDHIDNDIFIHIDKKSSNIPYENLRKCCRYSQVYIYSEIKIYWGDYSQTECELYLLEKAYEKKKYRYYHLLSGADMILVTQDYFHDFFEKNNGTEFVNIDHEILDRRFYEWFQVYHPVQKYIRRWNNRAVQLFFWKIAAILILLQRALDINRIKDQKVVFQKGANWFSITDDLVREVLRKKNWIKLTFRSTRSSDEIFLQTILVNSPMKSNINKQGKKEFRNLRYIDWDRGSPYVFRKNDFEELMASECLFARKFDLQVDDKIIEKIFEITIKRVGEDK